MIERLLACAADLIPLTQEEISEIEESLTDIKTGRIYLEDEIKKEFGVE